MPSGDQTAIENENMGSTFQVSHSKDGIAGNNAMKGAVFMNAKDDKIQNHSIINFLNQIPKLPKGKYKVVNGQIVPE